MSALCVDPNLMNRYPDTKQHAADQPRLITFPNRSNILSSYSAQSRPITE